MNEMALIILCGLVYLVGIAAFVFLIITGHPFMALLGLVFAFSVKVSKGEDDE